MSSSESSRARMTRVAPSDRASSTAAASVQVICVDAWIGSAGRDGPDELRHAEVLHDDRVDRGAGAARTAASTRGSSSSKTSVFERDVALRAVLVEVADRFAESRLVEVGGPGARVEPVEAEVDGVRAGVHRGAQRRHVAGGGEHLGAADDAHVGRSTARLASKASPFVRSSSCFSSAPRVADASSPERARPERHERARPVDRLRDARGLAQIELPQLGDERDELRRRAPCRCPAPGARGSRARATGAGSRGMRAGNGAGARRSSRGSRSW